MQYKNKLKEQILYDFKNNLLYDLILCDICDEKNCNIKNRKQPTEECFQPMREMYDKKYALEG